MGASSLSNKSLTCRNAVQGLFTIHQQHTSFDKLFSHYSQSNYDCIYLSAMLDMSTRSPPSSKPASSGDITFTYSFVLSMCLTS
mmetsp:Transcript_5249/g.9456  ORF Transcript_5249/g.9456 Transcript_5249/m.9456 type:complete len:84 (-) Transcript_5249:994-1245(-)